MAWRQNIQQISFRPYTPTRQLPSSSKNLLVTPKSNLKFYGDRSFQVAAPRLWNSLIDDIRSIQNLDVFKNKIKTLLFREAFISYLTTLFSFCCIYFPQLNLASRMYLIFQKLISTTVIYSLITQMFLIFRIRIIHVKRH